MSELQPVSFSALNSSQGLTRRFLELTERKKPEITTGMDNPLLFNTKFPENNSSGNIFG